MSLHILLLIFGKIYESFRDTWNSDDFGIFRNVFRIHDLNPGTRIFNIFIFRDQENIFSFHFFSFFHFLYSFLPSQAKGFPIFKNSNLFPPFHFPHSSSLIPSTSPSLWQILIGQREHLTPTWQVLIGQETPHLPYLHKNPSILLNYISFTNPNPI